MPAASEPHCCGEEGCDENLTGATAMTIDGVSRLVASLDDVIASKEAAGRDEDFEARPQLIRLQQQRRRRQIGR